MTGGLERGSAAGAGDRPLPYLTPQITLRGAECNTLAHAIGSEWLVSNGLGGFAAGTIGDLNTRRYHGLLIAALSPPVARTLMVAKIDMRVTTAGQAHDLFADEYADGTIAPRGFRSLASFSLELGLPVWRYTAGGALIEKRIFMAAGHNTTYVDLRVAHSTGACEFQLTPLCTCRDYHGHGPGPWRPHVRPLEHGFEISTPAGAPLYRVACGKAVFTPHPCWRRGIKHRIETERGLDDTEDLFQPGTFSLRLMQGERAVIEISAESEPPQDADAVQGRHRRRSAALLEPLPPAAPDWVRQLALAADQFIVRRQTGAAAGQTVIAGYPWFADWGRDTMIALPGLALVTGRFETAAAILHTYAGWLDQGMLPNRFPDGGEPPEYNTVDATLWYFHAIHQYTRRSGDHTLVKQLYPILQQIIAWHREGTRYGIRVDAADGLLHAGAPGIQLTWMDAKAGDWVVTPRAGKPVEVNALWYNALRFMAAWADDLGDGAAAHYRRAAEKAMAGFQRFWNPHRGCLYDVIDSPEGPSGLDGRLRPNQLLAVSLPFSPLEARRQAAVVAACERRLVTPRGLRSLAPGESGYHPRYEGDRASRDGAYHQGTAWAWLMGPFVDAHRRVYGDNARAMAYLEPFGRHLANGCVGTIGEIFDGEAPFTPRGCFAQAWSVAEVLRAWSDLHAGG